MSEKTAKKWYASKMVWVNILTSLAGVGSLTEFVPEELTPVVLTVAGIANVVLRIWFTNTKLEK